MTREQAEQIYYIKKEINIIESEIRELYRGRTYLSGVMYSDMPKAAGQTDSMAESDKYLDQEKTLVEMLRYNKEQLLRNLFDMNRFLITIDDSELRTILRLYCVEGCTWREIGDELHMDKSTANRKYLEFWNNLQQKRQDNVI